MIRFGRYALVLAITLLALAGCGGSDPRPAPASSPAAGLTAQETAFVEKVAAISPTLAEKPEQVARRGHNTCPDLTATDAATGQPWSTDKIAAQAVARFSGANTVTTAQAQQIVAAARETICAE